MTALKKDLHLIFIVLIPFIYLGIIYSSLPDQVPIHWNLQGEVDGYGKKFMLILIPVLLPLLTYLIFVTVRKIDPKDQLKGMGKKYRSLQSLLTAFMSIVALFIIHSIKDQTFLSINVITFSIGILYAIIGNYFKTIKANYFIGIRTPWTLESETVWKRTHILAGKLWLLGGILIVLASMILNQSLSFWFLLVITAIIALTPVIYSYVQFQEHR